LSIGFNLCENRYNTLTAHGHFPISMPPRLRMSRSDARGDAEHAEGCCTRRLLPAEIVRAEALPENVKAPAGLLCPSPAWEIVRAKALPEHVEAPAGLSCPSPAWEIVRAKALPEHVEAPAGLLCPSLAWEIVRAKALPEHVEAPAGLLCPSPAGVPNEPWG
jgi:hypothetical protein